MEYVQHWTSPGFTGYVDALEDLAVLKDRDELVRTVLTHEVAFWDVALG